MARQCFMCHEARQGKVYIDPSQNDYSDREAVAYCNRAHKQPTVSTPLFWDEVNDKLDVRKFRFDMILQRLEEKGDPWSTLSQQKLQLANIK